MAKQVLWQELRRNELERAAEQGAIIIIPVGSIEQHGDHLPVNTDVYDCLEIARRAAESIDEFPVLILPPVWTGFSAYHMGYCGTITIKFETLIQLLTQIAVSVHENGFGKMLFLNGHGGNETIVAAMRVKLASEDHIAGVLGVTWWDIPSVADEMDTICESDQGSIGHAGEMETSMQLYLQPDMVDKNAAVWCQGVYGDPATGTFEKGERLIKVATDALAALLRDFYATKLEPSLLGKNGRTQGRKAVSQSWRRRIRM